ncbi:FAD-dependent oxidoreductase [Candidatus Poribacteria bacterium]
MIEDLYDIVVMGGGLCGFSCAIKAAWSGKKALLVEKRLALGWESTWACQLDFSGATDAVAGRVTDELNSAGGLRENRADAPILEMVLDRLATEAGVSVLFHSYPVRLIFENNTALGVVIGNKSGEQIIKARVVVDATEEALLWRQTDIVSELNVPGAKQAIFFNHPEGEMELPLDLGEGIKILPSVWNDEVCVEFGVEETDPLTARRRTPEILRLVREEVPQLKDALVTHSGNEPFPISPIVQLQSKSIAHSRIKNFFGAGIWASEIENTPIGRLNLGEEVGKAASECEGVKKFPSEIMTGSYIGQPEVTSDVLVIGGGTGGAIAAIAAGRQGAKTALIEAGTSLGGMGTGGAIHMYCAGTSGGIQDEVDQRVNELTPLFAGKWTAKGFHPEVKKLVLQQMVEEANVDIFLNTVVTGVLTEEGRTGLTAEEAESQTAIAISEVPERMNEIQGIIAVDLAGVSVYHAKTFIDSTGDGDIAAMSGAPFTIGRERDNLTHTYSQSAGNLDGDGNLSFMNFDAGYVDPTDVDDLTRGRRVGLNQYWQDKFTDKTRVLYIAPLVGLRQSRQIMGEYQLTLADEIAGRRFADGISFVTTFYDNHGFDYENESDEAALWIWPLGNFSRRIGCEIPYRCMIPRNVDRLLLACRALSLTFDAHAGLRMQKDIQRLGEVAGVAAAMAARNGVSPREIDVKELQAILKESGVLDERFRPKTAIPEGRPMELPSPDALEPEQTEALAWISTYGGPESALAMRGMLNSDDPNVRFRAASALTWHKLDDGIQELLRCVENRVAEKTEGNKSAPIWQAAIPFLGMSMDKRAIPVLLGVLKDKNATLDGVIGAVRALERLGDESVIPDLRELLKRMDIPTERPLQMSMGALKHIGPATEDAKWQIELAIAETLSKLGAPIEEVHQVIEPHLDDARAHVRRYAKKLML